MNKSNWQILVVDFEALKQWITVRYWYGQIQYSFERTCTYIERTLADAVFKVMVVLLSIVLSLYIKLLNGSQKVYLKTKKSTVNNENDNFGNISAQTWWLHNPGRHAVDFQYHDLRLFITYHVCMTVDDILSVVWSDNGQNRRWSFFGRRLWAMHLGVIEQLLLLLLLQSHHFWCSTVSSGCRHSDLSLTNSLATSSPVRCESIRSTVHPVSSRRMDLASGHQHAQLPRSATSRSCSTATPMSRSSRAKQ